MAKKTSVRRSARLSPLAFGGMVAFALAVPNAASALPTDAGRISVSDVDGRTHAIWPDGSHRGAEFFDDPAVMTYSEVGAWHAGGTKVSVINPVDRSAAYVFSDPSTNPVTIPALNAEEIVGSAIGPNGTKVAVSSNLGITIRDGGTASNIFPDPAGTVVWSGEGTNGTIVWDGYSTGDSGGGLGGDPELAGTPTNGEGIGDGIWMSQNGGSPVEIITEDSASSPSISQDGRIVAWVQVDQMANKSDIWFMDLSQQSPQPQKLAASALGNDERPAVSPDGSQIAFVTGESSKSLVIGNVSGGAATPVEALETDVVMIAWQPATKVVAGAIGITGTADVGQMLSANPLTAPSGTAPFVDTFVWEACDDASADGPDPTCTQVGVGSFYTVKESDRGKRLRLVLTTRNVAGSSKSYSARTAVVPGGTPTPTDPTPTPTDPTPTPTDPTPTPTDPTPTPTDPTPTPTDPTPTDPTPTPAPAQPTLDAVPKKKTNKTSATFDFSGAQVGGRYECVVVDGEPLGDGLAWQDCESPATFPSLTEGKHTFYVRQIDDDGREGATSSYTWEIDTTEPVAPSFTKKPADATFSRTAVFEWTGSGEQGSGFQCRLDPLPDEGVSANLEPSIHEWHPCASPQQFDDLEVGKAHRFEVRERDAAGNYGVIASYEWVVNPTPSVEPPVVTPPAVEEKPVEKPVEPKPVVETPAVVQTPAVEAPKPAPKAEEPKKETPKPVVTPVKPPALTAVIGGAKTGAQVGANGGTSSAATIEVAKEAVGVGCSITGTVLKSCKVDLYAPKASGAKARAAAVEQVLVGTGTYESKSGSEKMDVRIELNATGKAMLRANPGGLKVTVKISGQPVSGAPLKATGVAKLVTDRASLTVGGFAVNSAVLTKKAKADLRVLARFGKAASVRCVGHTDGSTDDESYLKGLGERRAQAVCGFLAKVGVKATKRTLVTKADGVPVATNTTKAGRAKNRRVQVTLVR